MKISQQLNSIAGVLAAWAVQYNGSVDVASDMQQLWEWAMMKHDTPRVILAFDGEVPRGDRSVSEAIGKVDRKIAIAVTRGRGLLQTRGQSVTTTVGSAIPFADLYEGARDTVRSILNINIDDGRIPFFEEAHRMQMDGNILDGWIFYVSFLSQLPAIAATPTNQAPII